MTPTERAQVLRAVGRIGEGLQMLAIALGVAHVEAPLVSEPAMDERPKPGPVSRGYAPAPGETGAPGRGH